MTEESPPESGEYGCFVHGAYDRAPATGEMTCRKCEASVRAALLPDLYRVGPGKPMGYELLKMIRRAGFEPADVQRDLEERGDVVRLYGPDEALSRQGTFAL